MVLSLQDSHDFGTVKQKAILPPQQLFHIYTYFSLPVPLSYCQWGDYVNHSPSVHTSHHPVGTCYDSVPG